MWSAVERRGWEVIRIEDGDVAVEVLPGKGGDILELRWLPLDINVLWTTPWGLRQRGAVATAADSTGAFLESYPGGWQTIFPNGGAPSDLGGVMQGFHGEAALAAYDWAVAGDAAIEMTTRLARSPFRITKRVALSDNGVTVTETVRNEGTSRLDVMWSHHPAFGAPFLSGACRVEAPARMFVADPDRDTDAGDLMPGARSPWPQAQDRAGTSFDISRIPPDGPAVDRFGYLTEFSDGWMSLTNPELDLRVRLTWDLEVMPSAWFWLEARTTPGYPWFGGAYVLGLEPASSIPGNGIAAVRAGGGQLVGFDPSQERTAHVRLELGKLDGGLTSVVR